MKQKISIIVPESIYDAERKRIIAQILLNDFLEKGKDKWMEFRWGKKRFRIFKVSRWKEKWQRIK